MIYDDDWILRPMLPEDYDKVHKLWMNIKGFGISLAYYDFVFKGDYVGVNPDDPSDTYDLREGYVENATTSYPTFRYILQDVITEVNRPDGT